MTEYPFHKSEKAVEAMQLAYDQALAVWTIPAESVWVETRYGETHVIRAGDPTKPAFFYFHGWNGNATGVHDELDLPRLMEHLCIYMPDTVGQPGRSAQARPPLEGTGYSDWIADMLDGLGIERAIFSGVSGGGFLSLVGASHLPERVEAVFAIAAYGLPPSKLPPLSFYWAAISLPFGMGGARRFARMMAGAHSFETQHEGLAQQMAVMAQHYKPNGAPRPLTEDELGQIKAPVHVLLGGRDITMKVAEAASRVALIPNGRVEILPDEGHLFSTVGTGVFMDRVVAYLSQ